MFLTNQNWAFSLPFGKLTHRWKTSIFHGYVKELNGNFLSQTVSLPEGRTTMGDDRLLGYGESMNQREFFGGSA